MDSNAPLSQADCLITTTAIARLSLLLLLLLQEKIYRIQMANYNKGLGKLANISAEEAYANGFTKRTADKHRAGTISFEIRLPVDQRKLGIYEKRTSLRTGNSSTSTGLSIQLPKDSRMEYFHIFLLV